uniref:Repressed by TUP1 protein 1 n=1 Tax=Ganoderma boninense TaxID=34458 RepID=A0A5K1JRP4_9APHY|nr:Repressed by TUP1 protein 1 [Ganoderma boninense]
MMNPYPLRGRATAPQGQRLQHVSTSQFAPPNTISPPNTIPPNTIPPNTIPPNTIPPNTIPPNTIPPNNAPPHNAPPHNAPPSNAPLTDVPTDDVSFDTDLNLTSSSSLSYPASITYQSAIRLIMSCAPFGVVPPILALPRPGSHDERDLFRRYLLEYLPYAMNIRILTMYGRLSHPKCVMILVAVFRCPPDIRKATLLLWQLNRRLFLRFIHWRLSWAPEPDRPAPTCPAEMKDRGLRNLGRVSSKDAEWLQLLLKVLGDSTELWKLRLEFFESDAVMAEPIPRPAPQFAPQAAPANMYSNQAGSTQSLPHRGGGPYNPGSTASSSAVSLPIPLSRDGTAHAGGSRFDAPNVRVRYGANTSGAPQSHGVHSAGTAAPVTSAAQGARYQNQPAPNENPHGVQGGPHGSSSSASIQSYESRVQQAIIKEQSIAFALSNRSTLVRARTEEINALVNLIVPHMGLYFGSLQSILSGRVQAIPIPQEHVDALLSIPGLIGRQTAALCVGLKEDLNIQTEA